MNASARPNFCIYAKLFPILEEHKYPLDETFRVLDAIAAGGFGHILIGRIGDVNIKLSNAWIDDDAFEVMIAREASGQKTVILQHRFYNKAEDALRAALAAVKEPYRPLPSNNDRASR